ncbi:DUF4115 domain-containing protein [Nocardioidaceae bacterium]|nr:DUF4115 domain-containing protein [Nocardioidaceae bacterium]
MSTTSTERPSGLEETPGDHGATPFDSDVPVGPVVVRRRAALLLTLGALASSLAIAFLWRATGSGSWVDALVCAVLGAMGAGYLTALIDARAPLLVVDELGVRVRVGREWRGLPWESVDGMWLLPRDGITRDERLVVVPTDLGHVVEGLDNASVRSMRLTQRFHGAPLATPLGATTKVSGSGDLVTRLRALAGEHADVVIDPASLPEAQGTLEERARLTEEVLERREAVVRTLPGVPPVRADEVSHVALVPEQSGRDDEQDHDGDEAPQEFSVLGRLFDLRPSEHDAAAEAVADDLEERPATAEVTETVDTVSPAETVDANAGDDLDDLDDVDEISETLPDGAARTPWWRRRRTRSWRSRSARADAVETEEEATVEPVDTDRAADESTDLPTVMGDEVTDDVVEDTAPTAPTPRPVIGVGSTSPAATDPGSSVAPEGSDGSGESAGPDAPEQPSMTPAAHVSVAPLVPSRSSARRVEVVHRVDDAPSHGAAALDSGTDDHGVHLLPESAALRPGSDDLLAGSPYASPATPGASGATPLARPGDAVAPLVLGGFATRPAYDPVIGPEVRAARTRLGFSIDDLADRTRIRPHVLESIEVDDFAPSGGDVYARGHLRTLGRVLGKDAEVWVHLFDSRYAGGPTTAKRVFEAELATAVRAPRGPRSGPHWSLVAAVVLALGVVWAAATSLSDEPVEVVTPAPLVAPDAGQQADLPTAAPVRTLQLRTADQAASVTVRDADGAVVLVTELQPGETRRVRLALPVRVLVSEGGPVQLRYAGEARGQLAADGVVVPGREGEAALPSASRLR